MIASEFNIAQVRKLTAERDVLEQELGTLLGKRPTDLWVEDLDRFLAALKTSQVILPMNDKMPFAGFNLLK